MGRVYYCQLIFVLQPAVIQDQNSKNMLMASDPYSVRVMAYKLRILAKMKTFLGNKTKIQPLHNGVFLACTCVPHARNE